MFDLVFTHDTLEILGNKKIEMEMIAFNMSFGIVNGAQNQSNSFTHSSSVPYAHAPEFYHIILFTAHSILGCWCCVKKYGA